MSKALTLTLALAAILAGPALAGAPATPPAPARSNAGPGYNEQQFEAAYQHLKKMLAQMEQIKASKDPQERQRLLNEHRQAMRDGALALRPLHCQGAPARDCAWPAQRHGRHDRMGMMERRMDMMQLMMEQMVEREGQKSGN